MQRPSVLQLEQSFLSAWPAYEEHVDGGWIWRASNGYTKRANCAQSMDPHDVENSAGRLAQFCLWARARGNQPIFRVTPLAGEGVISALHAAGWNSFEQSVVMASPVGARFVPKHACRTLEADAAEWIAGQAHIGGLSPDRQANLADMVARIAGPVRGVMVDDADGPAASALTAVVDGIGIYLNVVVRPDLRAQGFGRSIMQSALNWSRDMGAQWAAMQVVADNTAALALYRGLGFDEVYRYHYRQARDEEAVA